MFSSRRLAKRSIIGTRVCCCRQDGRYYPGMIKATDSSPTGEDWYTVRFEGGSTANFFEKEIIGPGFQNIIIAKLVEGQKVYLTHNGREVKGSVVGHDHFTDDVTVLIPNPAGGDKTLEVTRPLEDCRLVESRKSARLQDQDTDYSRLADLHSENKKRTVSHVIDVPIPAAKFSRRRRSSSESDDAMVTEDKDEEMDTMDEHMAAMVLTSLSCSPVSPNFPPSFNADRASPGIASSFGSSGVSVMKSEPSTPSPPQVLNHSAPSGHLFGTPPIDEGIGLDDTHAYFEEETKKPPQSMKTVFKCTWPGCSKIMNFVEAIEKHVRDAHLEPKDRDSDDSDMSDHEEEFYYTEIEVSIDTVTDTFAEMHTSSPPGPVTFGAHSISDHDYQKKDNRTLPQTIPSRRANEDHQYGSFPLQSDTNISNFSRSWQFSSMSPPVKMTKFSGMQRGISASPKSSPMHKKSRAEVKKCRKVYGMENRDLWCTQCKWKKACSRFND